MTFYRLHTDDTRQFVPLEGTFAGPVASACWLIGGGPSLARLPWREIAGSPIPRMCVNLSGARLLRPTFWTSYDPSARFHRSVYLDPGVMKFVHRRRALDLVPETTFKVCDCPNLYFFDRDRERGFADFLAPDRSGIADWADSLVQAIDILHRLGFRTLYLAGCEMRIRPSPAQIARAAERGVTYNRRGVLQDFLKNCEAAGASAAELDALSSVEQYHFGERKPLRAAANTDFHYFRVVQYLRLSRRSMSLAGLRLVSVTPHSRLNDFFPYEPVRHVVRRLAREIGDPATEPTVGLYQDQEPRTPPHIGPMRDFCPQNWQRREGTKSVPQAAIRGPVLKDGSGLQHAEFLVEAEGVQRAFPPPLARGGRGARCLPERSVRDVGAR